MGGVHLCPFWVLECLAIRDSCMSPCLRWCFFVVWGGESFPFFLTNFWMILSPSLTSKAPTIWSIEGTSFIKRWTVLLLPFPLGSCFLGVDSSFVALWIDSLMLQGSGLTNMCCMSWKGRRLLTFSSCTLWERESCGICFVPCSGCMCCTLDLRSTDRDTGHEHDTRQSCRFSKN